METEDQQLYEELVAKYSKAFYKRVHHLFELEELEQEIWVAILEMIDDERYQSMARNKKFLAVTIRNHLINLLTKEFRKQHYFDAKGYDTVLDEEISESTSNPENLYFAKELTDKLKIKKIRHGEFVLDKITEGYTIREISDLAKAEGIDIGKTTVHKVVKKLREAAKEILNE